MAAIVVGVDGTTSSLRALTWALHQARLTGATVQAIHAVAFPDTVAGNASGDRDLMARLPATPAGLADQAERLLSAALSKAGAAAEGVSVVEEVVTDRGPAQALVDRSEGADLLVIGSRGAGGDPRLPLGSVSRYCTHHARCPVVIIPSPRPGAP